MIALPATGSAADSPHLQRLSIAAAEELRQTVRSALSTLLGGFIKKFTATLNHTSEKALVLSEKHHYHALAHSMAQDHARWVESFVQSVDAHLIGGVPQPAAPGVDDAGGAGISVALAQLELRAEARYQKLVTELDARINRLRLMLYVPVYTKALAPAGLNRALQDTADALNWPARQRGILFEKFDAMVMPELQGLYQSLIEAVTRLGSAAAKATAEAPAAARTKTTRPPRPKKSATAMQAPQDAAPVDPETIAMLETFALKGDGNGYTDGLLAADLLALADNRPLPGVAQDHSWVPLQRITLAGHFLNEVISDPMVPDELKPQQEAMRYPLVKSALTDETLFTSVVHPLGNMVHELLLKSATSRVTGNVETRRIADLLQQVLMQFDLAPEFVRQSMHAGEPLQETQIQRFFELQRQQAQQRRDFVISEAKRVVARQLENITFGRGAPAHAIKFLNVAWGPVLTKRLLQHGANHPVWNAGVALMEQLLDQLDAREPGEAPPAEWQELIATIDKALVAEGMQADRVKIALLTLEAARKAPPSSAL